MLYYDDLVLCVESDAVGVIVGGDAASSENNIADSYSRGANFRESNRTGPLFPHHVYVLAVLASNQQQQRNSTIDLE